tara:strand:+ start:2160 stop:2849 length:690 start_codon:yes stop_codon:yes gene_type:complete
MEVVIDYRENGIRNLYEEDYLTYANLSIGDIHIRKFEDGLYTNIVILERKTISDLQCSLRDGRFSEQKRRLIASEFRNKGYIIEGEPPAHDLKFINILRQLIIRLQFKDKLSIFFTKTTQDTVSLVKEIYRKIQLDPKLYTPHSLPEYVETLHVCKKDNLTPKRCFVLQISQIPSISKKIAQVIVDKYPSWDTLIQALGDKDTFIKSVSEAKIANKRYEQLVKYILFRS